MLDVRLVIPKLGHVGDFPGWHALGIAQKQCPDG